MTANQITAGLLIEIPRRFPDRIRVWRNNRVDAMLPGRDGKLRRVSAGIDGQGDITGLVKPSGRRIEVEVKAGKDRMRPSQTAFKFMIEDFGGLYLIARDIVNCLQDIAEAI